MTLFEILKQFKKIEPDSAFSATSKRAILALGPETEAAARVLHGGARVRTTMRTTILRILETGAAVALTGFFVLLITGAFSGTGLTPQYAAVNPAALRAEAQAIDIQIQLANLNYVAPTAQSTPSVAPAASAGNTTAPTAGSAATVAAGTATSTATSTATTTVTIDQALQNLAQ